MAMPQDLIIRDELFGGLIVQLPSERELNVNATGLAMIKQHLEGERASSFPALKEVYPDISEEVLQKDYDQFIRTFSQWYRGEDLEGGQHQKLGDVPPEPLSAPKEVFWEITWHCNLRCQYCYNSSGESRVDEMTTEECRRLIQEWGKLGVFKVIIGGGEPFSRSDLLEFLELLESNRIIPIVVTNATLIDEAIAGRLKALGMLRLIISLDGPTAEVNDSVRYGPHGSYDKTVAGIAALRKSGVDFSIQTVLTSKNLEHLEEMALFAHKVEADGWSVKRLLPYGRAVDHSLHLEVEQLYKAEERLSEVAKCFDEHFIDYQGLVPMEYALSEPYKDCQTAPQGGVSCGPGFINCGLSPDGRVLACNYMNDDEWGGLSFRENSFADLWKDSHNLQCFRTLTIDMLPIQCQTCDLMGNTCNGGCRAAAYLENADWLSADPDCPYPSRS